MVDSSSLRRRVPRAVLQVLFVLSLVWTAVFFAWLSLGAVSFLYPVWYELLDIREHVDKYGPLNYYRYGFEETTDAERIALFAQIADAINDGGRGLEALTYEGLDGGRVPLLRAPERIHLESVARLIDALRLFSYGMLAVLAVTLTTMWRLRVPMPRPRRVAVAVVAMTGAIGLGVLALGPERVFNTLHTWVFPPGEQWYFYYQESLMTTLMKAPDLFGAIALALVAVALAWFGLLLASVRYLLTRPSRSHGTR